MDEFSPWASYQIRKIAGYPCAGNAGNVLNSSFLRCRWRGKRSRRYRPMRNPQFYVSGKWPMAVALPFDWLVEYVHRPCHRAKHWGRERQHELCNILHWRHMSVMTSQITGKSTPCSTVCLGWYQRNIFLRGIRRVDLINIQRASYAEIVTMHGMTSWWITSTYTPVKK